MSVAARIAAAAAVAALAACGKETAPTPGALLNEPSAIAVFRGVTTKHAADPANPVHPYHPYFAVANASGSDLSVVDAVDDTLVRAPMPLRGVVYPVAGRPTLLASADLGDAKPDLLVAVAGGDSRLQVVRTWAADGAVGPVLDLADAGLPRADVLAMATLPRDGAAAGTAELALALAGERLAVVTFRRAAGGDAIEIAGVRAGATLGPSGAPFQAVALAVTAGLPGAVFAATLDELGPGVHGVARLDVSGAGPWPVAQALDARAPTRLVAAARLAERRDGAAALDPSAFDGQPAVIRVYAVLHESGCGPRAPIACGVVALDPVAGALAPDPSPAGPMQAPFRAPVPIGHAVALAASGPPAAPPPDDPLYAGTYLRVQTGLGSRATTAVAAVVGADGAVTFVDLGRWEIPSNQGVHANVKAAPSAARAPGSRVDQWLVLERPGGGVAGHADPAGLSTSVTVTAGYTPGERWTATHEGILPGLSSRRAEAGVEGGAPWLALQVTAGGEVSEGVRLFDPQLGVSAGDTVVIEPAGLGTCTTFEASVAALVPPDAARPGGAVLLAARATGAAQDAEWSRCLALVTGPTPGLRATIRAGGYVLVRGTGAAAVHVGRPELGRRFEVRWQDEAALAATCLLPPARAWPPSAADAAACVAGTACRAACEDLVRARLARRIGYLAEDPVQTAGPALAFTLALETAAAPPRDLALVIDTAEGRAPFRVVPTAGAPVGARAAIPFDRSPWSGLSGIRFVVPYASGIVLDATPTLAGGSVVTIR